MKTQPCAIAGSCRREFDFRRYMIDDGKANAAILCRALT
jgi:hypothetical protein